MSVHCSVDAHVDKGCFCEAHWLTPFRVSTRLAKCVSKCQLIQLVKTLNWVINGYFLLPTHKIKPKSKITIGDVTNVGSLQKFSPGDVLVACCTAALMQCLYVVTCRRVQSWLLLLNRVRLLNPLFCLSWVFVVFGRNLPFLISQLSEALARRHKLFDSTFVLNPVFSHMEEHLKIFNC